MSFLEMAKFGNLRVAEEERWKEEDREKEKKIRKFQG